MSDTYTNFDDEDHVRKTLQGEKAAYDALVRQYYGMVHAIALARLDGDMERADELTQEAFMRGYLHLPRLEKPQYYPAWLVQITRNVAADWKRKDRRVSALVQMVSLENPAIPSVAAARPSPRDAAVRHEEARQVHDALQKISEENRELLLLHYGEAMTQSEISRYLGVHPSTVMRKLNAAVAHLRNVYVNDPAKPLSEMRSTKNGVGRTLTVMAALWMLPAAQRTSLAATAEAGVVIPAATSIPFLQTTVAKGAAGIAAALIVAISWMIISQQASLPGGDSAAIKANGETVSSTGHETVIRAVNRDENNPAHNRALASRTSTVGIHNNASVSTAPVFALNTTSLPLHLTSPTVATERNTTSPAKTKYPAGTVVTESGTPLSDVQIHLSILTMAQPRLNFPSLPVGAGSVTVVTPAQPVLQAAIAHTDEHGTFHLDRRLSGTAALSIDHPPYAQVLQKVTLPADDIKVRLAMGGARAHGVVRLLETGDPVPGAEVTIWPGLEEAIEPGLDGQSRVFSLMGQRIKLQSDEQGRIHTDRLPESKLTIDAVADDLIAVPQSFLNPEKLTAQVGAVTDLGDIYLYHGHKMVGKVKDKATGEGIAGVQVEVMGRTPSGMHPTAVSDASGSYELKGLKPMPGTGKSANLSPHINFGIITATVSGYRRSSEMPRIEGTFDPDNLVIEQDFELTPEEPNR